MLRGQPIEFIFPLTPSDLELVNSLSDLKQRLLEQLGQSELRVEDARYRYLQQKGLYLYARCRWKGCKASLCYKREEELFRLMRSKCRHHHSLPQAKKTRLRLATEYMSKIPGMVPPASLKRVICPEFGVNEKQFYYLLSKIRAEKVTISDLVGQLEK